MRSNYSTAEERLYGGVKPYRPKPIRKTIVTIRTSNKTATRQFDSAIQAADWLQEQFEPVED